MIKQIVKSVFYLLPKFLQWDILAYRANLKTSVKINQWKKEGMPLPFPHEVKQEAIRSYQKKYKFNTLVETGTYYGHMIDAQNKFFSKIYSIELSQELWQRAVKVFETQKHIEILQGDSALVLKDVVARLNSAAIFWLDGHYSAGITARGEKDCPIYEELAAIFEGEPFEHILLIDDARHFVGQGDYPTIEELENYLKSQRPNYKLEVKDDIIRFEIYGS